MAESLEAQLETIAQESAFLKKYFSLRKKCEQIQQANEKLVNRLQHVKKLVKRYKRERRFLVSKLDEYGDSYRDAQVPVMWEDNLWRPPPPYPGHSKDTEDKHTSHNRSGSSALSAIHPLLQAHGLGDASKTKKIKTEKEKNTGAPKKPANAFLMFCQQRRASVQEQYFKEHHEDIAHHELTKRLATEWNGLSSDGKQIFFDLYEKEKERYEKELKEYSEMNQSQVKESPHSIEGHYSEAALAAMNLEAQSAVSALMGKENDD